jgi:hypothetical protein
MALCVGAGVQSYEGRPALVDGSACAGEKEGERAGAMRRWRKGKQSLIQFTSPAVNPAR